MNDPWERLTHDTILTAAEEASGLTLSNLILQRNSYINRVYELKVRQSEERIIIKFYRPGRWTKSMILEEHRFLLELSEAELPVIAPLIVNKKSLFTFDKIHFTLFPKMGGRALDELGKEDWLKIGRLLGRVHLIGDASPSSSRIKWSPQHATQKSIDYLLKNNHLPDNYIPGFKQVMKDFMAQSVALFEYEECFLIHGDCHLGNLIHRPGEGLYIVDFDDMSVGPAVQDLWMLLPGPPEQCEQEIDWFVEGYELFRDFNPQSLDLIPALKVMRLIHFASWCAMQSHDRHFQEHFPEWGTTTYWNELVRDIQASVYYNDNQ
jgi:Ser/Thr protein kinase RdoA (MazF antagonist)